MNFLRSLSNLIDTLSEQIGQAVSWLTLFMVLTTFTVVGLRYLFDLGWIAMQESITYLHACVFMLGAAYTLKSDGHVRVDILYRPLSPHGKAWIDLLGTLSLLLPVSFFLFWMSWEYVESSWILKEGSREAGGLDLVWLLKSVMLVMPILIALQGISQLCHSLLTLLSPRKS